MDVVGWHERRGNRHGTSLKTRDGRAAIRDDRLSDVLVDVRG